MAESGDVLDMSLVVRVRQHGDGRVGLSVQSDEWLVVNALGDYVGHFSSVGVRVVDGWTVLSVVPDMCICGHARAIHVGEVKQWNGVFTESACASKFGCACVHFVSEELLG